MVQNVGCDWQLDSDVLEDRCGICGGSGTECTLVEGDYTDTGKSGECEIVNEIRLLVTIFAHPRC